jgi:hypothetical protein
MKKLLIAFFMVSCMVLSLQGCSTQSPEEKAAALAAERAEAEVLAEAAAKIAARPSRLEIVSQEVNLGRYCFAIIVKDKESGTEFFVVNERVGDAVAITQIRIDEQR